MFLHNLKYELISTIRFKDRLFWIILFPIILGAFFKAAFSGIYDNVETFSAMPVAVVGAENDQVLHSMLDSIENSDEPLLKVTYSDEDEALDALVREDILGIITPATSCLSLWAAPASRLLYSVPSLNSTMQMRQ